jgi:hypothetical protein
MGRPDDDEQVEKFLSALRAQGGVSGNAWLTQQLGWGDQEYWRIREKALAAGAIVRGRGRGGSVRLVETAKPGAAAVAPTQISKDASPAKESDLYEPCLQTLQSKWSEERGLQDCHVEITAWQGRRPTGGEWTRPDIVALSMRTFTHWPGRYFDVWTFEIKPEWEFSVTGVFEAAAHARASTNAYAMFHVPTLSDKAEETLDRCVAEAQRFGVGLVVLGSPKDFSTWDFKVDPVRREPDPALLEQFIASQMSEKAKSKLARWQK